MPLLKDYFNKKHFIFVVNYNVYLCSCCGWKQWNQYNGE